MLEHGYDYENVVLNLKDARYRLETVGWCQGAFYETDGLDRTTTTAYCAVGALQAAVGSPDDELVNVLKALLDETVSRLFGEPKDVVHFNDHASRVEQVLAVFDEAIRWEVMLNG